MIRSFRMLALALAAGAVLWATSPESAVAQDDDAASLTGTWAIMIESPEGTFEFTMELEQHEDATVSGTMMTAEFGEMPVESGWVDGDAFGLSVVADAGGQMMEVIYEGTFTEFEIVGTIDVGGGMFFADFIGERVEGDPR